VPDLRDETTEDGFHEIQLSGKQLIFLFMASTVMLIFVFLVGVLVGRGVDAKRGDEPIASAEAVASPADLSDAGPPPTEPPSPPVEDELSYHSRLQSNAAPEELKPQPKEEQKKPEPPAAQPRQKPPADAAGVPTTGRPGTWVLQIVALRNRANAAELVQRLVGKGYPAYLQEPTPGEPVIYRVRVGRFKDRREAEQVRDRLQKEEDTSSVISR
jgi:cell division septation protein DedD